MTILLKSVNSIYTNMASNYDFCSILNTIGADTNRESS